MFIQRMNEKETEALYGTAKEIANFFNELKLQWWLSHGSLLGAWRHRGIIPWDDDLDFAFPREFVCFLETKAKEKNLKFKRLGPFLAKIWNPASAVYANRYEWTWPNVDVTLYDYFKDKVIIEFDHHQKFHAFSASAITPTRLHSFGVLQLPIPNEPATLLNLIYPDWQFKPKSSQYSHRFEEIYVEPAESKSINDLNKNLIFLTQAINCKLLLK